MENNEDLANFLDTSNLPRLNQEDMQSLNRAIISHKIELVIKSLPSRKLQDLIVLRMTSTKHFKMS